MGPSCDNRVIYIGPTLAQLEANQCIRPIRQFKYGRGKCKSSVGSSDYDSPLGKRKRARYESHAESEVSLRIAKSAGVMSRQSNHIFHAPVEPTMATPEKQRKWPVLSENMIATGGQDGSNREENESTAATRIASGEESRSIESYHTEVSDTNEIASSSIEVEKGKATFVVPKMVNKSDLLKLGPARIVGLSRLGTNKPTLLKALERSKSDEAGKVSEKSRSVQPPASVTTHDTTRRSVDDSSVGVTTVESIPPPPTHNFSLSNVTSISRLLSNPNEFLASHHGGNQYEVPLKFNILALVTRIGGLEDAPDYKAGKGKRMDRCEMVVKDASGCALKVILEGDCATQWATPSDQVSLDHRQDHSYESSTDRSNSSSDNYCNSLEASVSAFQDDSTSASRTTIERQKDDRLLPIRPGDVIVLSRLYIVRPRQQKKGQQQRRYPSSSSSRTGIDRSTSSTHAVASSASNANIEICWRNAVQNEGDQRRNFDKCLTLFDARCKAIYHLAQGWE